MNQRSFNSRAKFLANRRLLSKVTLIIFCFSLMLGTFAITSNALVALESKVFKAGIVLKAGETVKVGIYSLAMERSGNLIYKKDKKAIWQTNTAGKDYDYAYITKGGSLRLHNAINNKYRKITPVITGAMNAELYMDNAGRFYIYTKSHAWRSSNITPTQVYSEITAPKVLKVNKLKAQEILRKGEFRFVLSDKGNLAIRRFIDKSKVLIRVWESGTSGKDVASLNFGADGNLVLKSSNGTVVWQSKNPVSLSKLSSYTPTLRLYDSGLLAVCGWNRNAIIQKITPVTVLTK